MVQTIHSRNAHEIRLADPQAIGFVMPPDVMVSFHAMAATGFWNQIRKIGHALYLLRYIPPFIYNCREGVASPRIYSFFKALLGPDQDLLWGASGRLRLHRPPFEHEIPE
jgi:hypothetical protein